MYCTVFQSVRHYIVSLVQLYWPRFKETAPAKTCTQGVTQWLVVSNWHVDSHSWDKDTNPCTHFVNYLLLLYWWLLKAAFCGAFEGRAVLVLKIAKRSAKWATLTRVRCYHWPRRNSDTHLTDVKIDFSRARFAQTAPTPQISYQSIAQFFSKDLVSTEQFTAT